MKLADFGLAKVSASSEGLIDDDTTEVRDVTQEGYVLGTTAYMSPEQAKGASVDARSDVFSFGVLLHELLSGSHPFRRASSVETLSAILNDAAGSVSNAKRLQPVVDRCLAKAPSERPESMAVVLDEIERARAPGNEMDVGLHQAGPADDKGGGKTLGTRRSTGGAGILEHERTHAR